MIDVAIKFDNYNKEYLVYIESSDTLLKTTSLGDSFLRLDNYLKENGLISENILNTLEINYHIDSEVFIQMVKSNSNLLKRLNTAPSGFQISNSRFGVSNTTSNNSDNDNKRKSFNYGKSKFSDSKFTQSYKKFGGMP